MRGDGSIKEEDIVTSLEYPKVRHSSLTEHEFPRAHSGHPGPGDRRKVMLTPCPRIQILHQPTPPPPSPSSSPVPPAAPTRILKRRPETAELGEDVTFLGAETGLVPGMQHPEPGTVVRSSPRWGRLGVRV